MTRKKKTFNYLITRRINCFFIIFLLVFGYLICEVAKISILKNDEYESRIQKQSSETISLNSGRGIIYDRNNIPLTDNQKKTILIVLKKDLIGNYETINLIKKSTSLEEEDIYKSLQEQLSKDMIEIEADYVDKSKIKELSQKNILVKEKSIRYSSENLLTHLIGYIKTSENNGVSGIEKSMNEELKNSNENYLSVFKAGTNNKGLGYIKGSIEEFSDEADSSHLKLTIDKSIQKNIEEIMDKEQNPSAVVISDVQTGEVLGLCSRPNFNQNNISSYADSVNGELQNRALSVTYPPGSVFKLVVLYAALENNVIDENYKYNCSGSTKIGTSNETLNCNEKKSHGNQTLEQALANSCNCAFYDIAKRVGTEKIFEAIKTLHLDESVDLGIDEEKTFDISDEIALSNLAIGQSNIEFTPLQINQMTQIIANNGTYMPLYIYDSIIDNDKNTIKEYKANKDSETISPYTMIRIKSMMEEVADVGTAKILSNLDGACGVKTGTAQSSLNGEDISHGWITGYYPRDNPKYVITIVVEGTKDSSKSATPVFREICENLK